MKKRLNVFLQEKKRCIRDFGFDDFIRECTEEITQKEDRKKFYTTALNKHLTQNKKPLASNICEVFVVDLEGEIIASTNGKDIGKNVSAKKYFKKALLLSTYVGDSYYDVHLKEIVIDISTVLLSKIEPEPIGIIVNRIYVEYDEEGMKIGTSADEDYKERYSQLLAVNKARIIDFGSDGFIRDCTEDITRKEDRVKYYTTALNEHLTINKQPLDPDILTTFIVDFTGKIIGSTEISSLGKDVSGDGYFRETMNGGACIIDLHRSPELKQNTFEMARLMLSNGGKTPIGVIVNRYRGDSLERITLGSISAETDSVNVLEGFGKTGELYIVNRDNLMITGSRFVKDAALKQVVDTEGAKVAVENGVGMIGVYPDYRGIQVLGVSRYIEEMDWVILAEKDISEAFAPVIRLRNITIVMLITGIIIIVLIVILLSARITKPIRRLVAGTRKVAGGNLDYKIEIESRDEIGDLATSFNDMTSQLGKSKKLLQDYTLSLEKKIEVKTSKITRAKEYTENLIETAQDAIVCIDENGIVNVWNQIAEKIFGYTKSEIIGQSLTTIIPERYRKKHKEGLVRFLKTRETKITGKTVRIYGITKKGIEIPIEISLSFQKDGENLYSFMSIIRDITEKRKQENEIRKLSSAIEQCPVSVVITDTKGNIEYVNKKFMQATGYNYEEVIGENPRVLKSDETTSEEYKELWETITSGNEWCGEFHNKKKNGQLYWEYASISPIKSRGGKITHFVAIKEDITERKRAEEALKRAKEDAEVANHAKGEFLANMSHEIRTPMNGIIGMTELILDTKLTPEQYDCAKTVRESADSLLSIINDILDFSKIEAGKMEIENIDFDLRIAVESAIDILAVKADEKRLEFSSFIDPEVPSMLRGDPGRLRQVLVNLVNNALKFTKDGEVAVSVMLDGETDSHATLRFAVRDTGIGIPADRLNCLFQSFSQVDASTTRKYGGTGLGLSISKQIAELMGGRIGVESEDGKGSTFWFTAILEKQPLDQQQPPIKPGNLENLRVLVVDDNGTNRRIFRAYLESWHCSVEDADSAAEAMRKLRNAVKEENPFQVALIDLCMPDMNGESLGREIKLDARLKGLILLMLTSVGKRGDAEFFRKLGFSAYLNKPVKQIQLLECLQIVTGKTRKSDNGASRQIITRYSISENHKKSVRILMAEDNMVNQKIALRILEKKLGYHADAVTNGKEAVESLEKLDYDLVLMDCQMPEMDGYEATGTIRDRNSAVRNHNIPIIAMTANAMKGDREKCLEAGMDDYITKPINVKSLGDAISRNL